MTQFQFLINSIPFFFFFFLFKEGAGRLIFFGSAAVLVQCLRATLLCVSAQARRKYCEHRAVLLPPRSTSTAALSGIMRRRGRGKLLPSAAAPYELRVFLRSNCQKHVFYVNDEGKRLSWHIKFISKASSMSTC